jgi:RNA polymerase sigma-70 factor (ECF subfamily)
MVDMQEETSAPLTDPETWVESYGDYLFRYARHRVQNRDVAEDLVQETLMAALRTRDGFEGRSSERTWLLSILRHKMIDYIRKASRERPTDNGLSPDDLSEEFFDEKGMWAVRPSRWDTDPGRVLEKKEFWEKLMECLAELPKRMAQAFSLRKLEQMDSEEVSETLEVTSNNLGVLLYRARLRLRRCLEVKWLGIEH